MSSVIGITCVFISVTEIPQRERTRHVPVSNVLPAILRRLRKTGWSVRATNVIKVQSYWPEISAAGPDVNVQIFPLTFSQSSPSSGRLI